MFITNVNIFRSMAEEAHHAMHDALRRNRRPKADDSSGWIVIYDPNHRSFKQAMIVIAFTSAWFDAFLHLLIVDKYNVETAEKLQFKHYEVKLKKLGHDPESGSNLFERVKEFCSSRNRVMHENAHIYVKEIRVAQEEADRAIDFMQLVTRRLRTE